MQVLEAANTGITSLQSLVSSAQSVANQVLQTPVGYSTKSAVSTATITGATANNLLGTGAGYTDATFSGATATGTLTAAFTSAAATGVVGQQRRLHGRRDLRHHAAGRHRRHHLQRPRHRDHRWLHAGRQRQDHHLLDRHHESSRFGARPASPSASAPALPPRSRTFLSDIDAITGATGSSVTGGKLVLQTGTAANLTISGTATR